jgi:hypothetical protein
VIVPEGPTTYVNFGPQAKQESAVSLGVRAQTEAKMQRMSATLGATLGATMAVFLLSGSLVLAQGVAGYGPGVNPSNPQDMTNRSNPQNLTLPGASNPQDLVRSPAVPKALSSGPARDFATAPLLSPSLSHTYTVKPAKKFARRKHGIPAPETQ